MKPHHRLIPLVALLTGACSLDIFGEDPRVGDQGRVAFRSEGCASGKVMAQGSRASLRLESATAEPLPAELEVTSSSPEVIDVAMTGPAEVVLTARASGDSYLSVFDMGRFFDGLGLSVAPATLAEAHHPDRVLLGGRIDVSVAKVYGPCPQGGMCELFGEDFLSWTTEPGDAFLLESEESRRVSYTATTSGRILAREPARGATLVRAEVEVVAPGTITGFSARVVTIPSDGSLPQGATLPAAIPPSDRLCLMLDALRGSARIPISHHDLDWELEGAVARPTWGSDLEVEAPLCTVVEARQPGEAVLRASSPLFEDRPSFELTVR
jgi:hypothetical protein